MIADGDLSGFETAVKFVTAPIWVPIYLIGRGCSKIGKALKRKEKPLVGEILAPTVWIPKSEVERAVFAAIVLAGGPVTNAQLAKLMRVSPSEASKRVSQLAGVVCKERVGREVRISLPRYLN
jgi:hypothetical protein